MSERETQIPQLEVSGWRTDALERLRALYPMSFGAQELREVVSREASPVFRNTSIINSLSGFSVVYGGAAAMLLDFRGKEFDPALTNYLSGACLAGALVAIDINAHTLSEADRRQLYDSTIHFNLVDEANVSSAEEYERAVLGVVVAVIQDVEERKTDVLPFELREIAEAMFSDSPKGLAIEQETAFAIGATMIYDHIPPKN